MLPDDAVDYSSSFQDSEGENGTLISSEKESLHCIVNNIPGVNFVVFNFPWKSLI
jgi:hypothetical protein